MSNLVRSPVQSRVRLVSGAVFLGQAAERETDQSPPSSADVKNKWIHTSTPPRCLQGLERDRPFYRVLWLQFGWMPLCVMLVHWKWNVGFLSLVIDFIIDIWSLIPSRITDFSLRFHFLASTCLPWSPGGLGVKRTARLYHSWMFRIPEAVYIEALC